MDYVLITKIKTKPNKRQEVIDIMLKAGELSRNNSACKFYILGSAKDDPDTIWVQDIWTSESEHQAFLQSAEMGTFIQQAMPYFDGMPELIPINPVVGKF